MNSRPFALSIAGFDPSGGAGLLADAKVFEYFGVQGQGVCTAVTVQNETEFLSPGWVNSESIIEQMQLLQNAHSLRFCKIGLVRDLPSLLQIVEHLRKNQPDVWILWDPILKASAGFSFHDWQGLQQASDLAKVLSMVDCITPNLPEWNALQNALGEQWIWPDSLAVLCKGGHALGSNAEDVLYSMSKDGMQKQVFVSARIPGAEKHGSGCVLSAAILAHMASGHTLPSACQKAKKFMQSYLVSQPGLLGQVHKNGHTKPTLHPIHCLTWDESPWGDHVVQVERLLQLGARTIQFRCKSHTTLAKQTMAQQCVALCHAYGAHLIINDDPVLCALVQADGVHLGLSDMPVAQARSIVGEQTIIGGTAHTLDEIQQRIDEGVDYIGLGPYAQTQTKSGLRSPLGFDGVRDAVALVNGKVPLVVIGGIDESNVELVARAKADGIAVCSGLVGSTEPQELMQKLLRSFYA